MPLIHQDASNLDTKICYKSILRLQHSEMKLLFVTNITRNRLIFIQNYFNPF